MTEDLRPPFRQQFDNARDPYTARNALGITSTGGGGGSGAPDDAEYIVAATDPTLTNERVLTNTATITWDFTTPGQAKASTAAGGGNVSNSGTPTLGQYAKWTTATTIQGVSAATVLGDIGAQPLDADLTAIAALTGTNTIYYRSAANTWSPVVVSTGLSFSGGTLTCTVSAGGNVSNSGTPTAGQYGKWVTATTIQGVAPATVLSDIGAQPAGSYQPLDGDLTAIAALTGTNTIYFRSGSNTWAPVVVSTGLAFSGGNLTATGGGGAFTASSTAPSSPNPGDLWYDLSNGVLSIYVNDGSSSQWVMVSPSGGASVTDPTPPQGRLTLQSGVSVMTTTQAAKTTIFYTPYVGNKVPIYDGSNMIMTTFAELSVATTDTTKSPAAIGASKVNDWFVWNDAGTIRIGHGPDWTSDTARSAGTALLMVNGILLNNAAITNGPVASRGTYVGTTRSNASSQLDWIYGAVSAGGTEAFFGVWNAYNRIMVTSNLIGDNTDTWLYASGFWRAANAKNTMRCSFVCGLNEDAIFAQYNIPMMPATSSSGAIGIGLDTTSNYSGNTAFTNLANLYTNGTATYNGVPGLGFHFVQAVEFATGSGITFAGDLGVTYVQSGLIALMMG